MSLIEVMVAVVVLTVSVYMLSSTITSAASHRSLKREIAAAAEAAKQTIETIRSQPFAQVFALYDHAASNDPGGPGTAPGPNFAVPGLKAWKTDADGMAGEIVLPSPGPALYENGVQDDLGMPRDLNGDMKVDALDHASDYVVLPVNVVIRWEGVAGPRTFQMATMLAYLVKKE